MCSFSIWHLLALSIFWMAVIYPLYKIITKAGYSGWLVLVIFVPIVNLVAFWFFAFSKWPNLKDI